MTSPSTCEECGAAIVVCDNRVHLDYPAVAYDDAKAQWTLMQFGSQVWASAGNPSFEGLGHTLHEHQPPEGDES